jgi:hypothetical protein
LTSNSIKQVLLPHRFHHCFSVRSNSRFASSSRTSYASLSPHTRVVTLRDCDWNSNTTLFWKKSCSKSLCSPLSINRVSFSTARCPTSKSPVRWLVVSVMRRWRRLHRELSQCRTAGLPSTPRKRFDFSSLRLVSAFGMPERGTRQLWLENRVFRTTRHFTQRCRRWIFS